MRLGSYMLAAKSFTAQVCTDTREDRSDDGSACFSHNPGSPYGLVTVVTDDGVAHEFRTSVRFVEHLQKQKPTQMIVELIAVD